MPITTPRLAEPKGIAGAAAAVLALSAALVWGASHSDAPLISLDPQANITDVYAFVGTKYDAPATNVLNVVVQVFNRVFPYLATPHAGPTNRKDP